MLENTTLISQFILAFSVFTFLLAFFLKRSNIIDALWGPGIFVFCFLFFVITASTANSQIAALTLVFIWATRLFIHQALRFFSETEENFRYKKWRDSWKYFYLRSYFQIFLLQTILMAVMASIFIIPKNEASFTFVIIGCAISLFGLFYESVGDWQLKKFLEKKTGGFMKTGLWATTRHPNYFGEVTFWWGIFIIFIPSFLSTLNPLFLLTPLTITFLILKVSGIPMLEKKYAGNSEWEEYKKVTPAFFPKFF